MGRDYARVRVAVWIDDDFRKLSPPAQHLYFVLLTSPSLSYCGVADWRPGRLGALADGWGADAVQSAAAELAERLYVVVDEETEEVLVRSFIRHDGLMKEARMAVSMVKAFASVASNNIRGVIVHELRRLHDEDDSLKGWFTTSGAEGQALSLLRLEAIDPADLGVGLGVGLGQTRDRIWGSVSGSTSPTPTPTPTPKTSSSSDVSEESDLFAEFWKHYPRKDSKQDAMKAWRQVTKDVKPALIVEAVQAYPFKPERNFQPLPGSWLRGRRWDDEAVQLPLGGGSDLSSTDVQNILGPDHWVCPRPPVGMSDADEYAWEQRQRREHIEARQAQARARLGRTA